MRTGSLSTYVHSSGGLSSISFITLAAEQIECITRQRVVDKTDGDVVEAV